MSCSRRFFNASKAHCSAARRETLSLKELEAAETYLSRLEANSTIKIKGTDARPTPSAFLYFFTLHASQFPFGVGHVLGRRERENQEKQWRINQQIERQYSQGEQANAS
jgi:hypothetical protein